MEEIHQFGAGGKQKIEELADFKNGIVPFMEKFLENIRMLYALLYSNIITDSEKKTLFDEIKEIDFILKEIQNRTRNLIIEFTKENIESEARRSYYSFFQGNPDDNKYNYIILTIYSLKLREYYDYLYLHLSSIKNKVIQKISDKSQFYFQFIEVYLKTIFIKLSKIFLLLEKLNLILNIDKEIFKLIKSKKTQILYQNYIRYNPQIKYRFSLIFAEDLSEFQEKQTTESVQIKKEEEKTLPKKEIKKEVKQENVITKSSIRNNILDTSGNHIWNSSMYYFLSYDPQKIKREEEECFQNVFYIDNHLGATEEKNRSEVIRTFLKKEKIIPSDEAKEKYKNFLNILFQLNKDILIFNFQIEENESALFLYHLGPLAFFDIIKKYLLNLQTGGIHQIIKKNTIRKVIPLEFIKKHLFEWWIDEVMEKTSSELRNNYEIYVKLASYIQRVIFRIQKEFLTKFPSESAIYENPNFRTFLEQKIGPVNIALVHRYWNLFKTFPSI